MKFYGWTNRFDNQILYRGYEYYLQQSVSNIQITDGILTATVSGSEDYTVKIRFSGSDIISMDCTCPFAHEYTCKHMAAVLFAVQNITPYENAVQTTELKKLIEEASESQIRKFLLKLLCDDEILAVRFKTMVSPSYTQKDYSVYKKKIDSIALNCTNNYGYVDYRQLGKTRDEISELIEKDITVMTENGSCKFALDIVIYIFEAFEDIEDYDGNLYELGKLCEKGFEKILLNADEETTRKLFNWCIEKMESDSEYSSSTMDESIYNFFENHFDTGIMASQKLEYVKEQGENGSSVWMKKYLELLSSNKTPWTKIADYCKANLSFGTVRDWYVEKCISHRNLAEAIRVLELAFNDANKEGDKYNACCFANQLKELYAKKDNKEKLFEILWWLIENQRDNYNADYLSLLRQLKPFYDSEKWIQEREKIFKNVCYSEELCRLYKEEKLYERLKIEVLKSDRIDQICLYTDVLQDYAPELLDKYESLLQRKAKPTTNRHTYNEIANELRKMKKINGGKERVQKILQDWRIIYKARKAMLDELSRV